MPRIRQRKTELFGLGGEEPVGNLYQHPGTVTHQRIGPYGSAVGEIFHDSQPVLDDPVRFPIVQIDDEPDAAGVALVSRIEQSAPGGKANRRVRISAYPCTFASIVGPRHYQPRLERRLFGDGGTRPRMTPA